MSRSERALLGREIGRLAAGRMVLFGGLVALLLLGFLATLVVEVLVDSGADAVQKAAVLRTRGLQLTRVYDSLLLLLAAVLGSSLVASDIRRGTIFGILARPVSRTRLLLTSWAASAMFLTLLEAARSVTLLGASAWLEGRIGAGAVLGALALAAGHCLLLAGFAALGAAFDVWAAAGIGLTVLTVAELAFGSLLGGMGKAIVDTVACVLPLPNGQERVIESAMAGGSASLGPVAEAIAYRLCWTAVLLALGAIAFERRDLTPRI